MTFSKMTYDPCQRSVSLSAHLPVTKGGKIQHFNSNVLVYAFPLQSCHDVAWHNLSLWVGFQLLPSSLNSACLSGAGAIPWHPWVSLVKAPTVVVTHQVVPGHVSRIVAQRGSSPSWRRSFTTCKKKIWQIHTPIFTVSTLLPTICKNVWWNRCNHPFG